MSNSSLAGLSLMLLYPRIFGATVMLMAHVLIAPQALRSSVGICTNTDIT